MLKELEDIGLSENEAKVYLASLELGPATADQLAKQAKIKRPTTYVQIKSLMDVGLMSTYEEGKKTFFAPESPELLKRLLLKQREAVDVRERDLSSFLPELIRQFEGAEERPLVRFFDGREGIRTMREEMLETSKTKEFLTIYSLDNLSQLISKEDRDNYSERRVKLGIRSRLLYTNKGGKLEQHFPFPLTERRYVPTEKLPIQTDIVIFDEDKIALSSLRGRLFGVIVQSTEIALSFRAIFNFIWEHVPEE